MRRWLARIDWGEVVDTVATAVILFLYVAWPLVFWAFHAHLR